MNKVLVLGGTGVMGKFLVEELSNRYQVEVTSRNKIANVGNIIYWHGDAHNNDFLNSILEKTTEDYVAIVDFMHYTTNEFAQRYEKLLEHTEQLVFVSSSRVYADSNVPIKETNKRLLDCSKDKMFLGSDDYALAKARQEDILLNSSRRNWTIVRPYMTYSYKKMDLGWYPKEVWLYRVLNGRCVVFPDDVAERYTTLSYGADVAKAIAALISNREALGKIFHITSEEKKTWNEVISTIKSCLLSKGYEMNVVRLSKSELTPYIHIYDRCYNRVFDNTNIRKVYDTTSFVGVEEGLDKSLSQFIKAPRWGHINWGMQAYMDRITGEKTPFSEIKTYRDRILYFSFRYLLSYATFSKCLEISVVRRSLRFINRKINKQK